MQRDLSRLTRELQNEKCPRRVCDEVQRRVFARGHTPGWRHRVIPAVAAGLVLAGFTVLWQWPAARNVRPTAESPMRATQSRLQTANQAAAALELIGSIAARAGALSEKAVSDRAVPPLRNSLYNAQNQIIHHLQL